MNQIQIMADEADLHSLIQPSSRRTPRRCVQSKLIWHQSPEEGQEYEEEEGGGEEEYVENENKSMSKKKRKAKTTPSRTRSRKKASLMSKEAEGLSAGKKNSVVAVGSDFFVKVSERKLRQKQRQEKRGIDLRAGDNKCCEALESIASEQSFLLLKERDGDAAPYNNLTSAKGSPCRRAITNYKSDVANDQDIQNEHRLQTVIDLRLQSKIAAEENARLSAGRQTHPFFSMRKGTKRFQEILYTEVDSKLSSILQEDEIISCPPVHVIEALQDDLISLDWKDWIFYECDIHNITYCGAEKSCFSVFEGSVEPLKFDSFVTISSSLGTPFPQKEVCYNQFSDGEYMFSMPTTSSMFVDGKEVYEEKKVGSFSGNSNSAFVVNLEDELQDRLLPDRMTPYHLQCRNHPDNCTWTNKYQPKKASEVCGNVESVRFLSQWLNCWRERVSLISKIPAGCAKFYSQDSFHGWNESDSDTENMDEVAMLKNVLLVTGPVGSGKSAAIYACAKEQGFEVIEINASHWRNGAHVKEKFGEAMESHGFNKWPLEESAASRRKHVTEYSSAQSVDTASPEFGIEVVDATVVENKTACRECANKTLILFEDVDTIFDEDKGFISTLVQLAETGKRPMILTSNSKDPVLPQLLDRLVVYFTFPSPEELLSHVYMVCSAEKINVSVQLIDRFIRCCQGDLRKIIMLLQFWCQGEGEVEDRYMKCRYSPLQFDLDAAHQIMPKLSPWEFPCQLSNLVEKEILKAQSMMKENICVMVKEEKLKSQKIFNETDSIEAQKEAMLSRNFSARDCTKFSAQFVDVDNISDASCSPVKFVRRSVRHKSSAVLSSHSEDEFCTDNLVTTSDILFHDTSDEFFPDAAGSPVQRLGAPDYLGLSTDQICHSEEEISNQILYKSSETTKLPHICDTNESIDVSCVPESSFVPDTEINNHTGFLSRTIYCEDLPVSSEGGILSCVQSFESPLIMEVSNFDKIKVEPDKNSGTAFINTCEIDVESVHGNEELGDSQSDHVEAVTRGYLLRDECSRVDFSREFLSPVNPDSCPMVADLVHETWRKLRRHHEDLKSYITSEERDAYQMIKLASGMTNLISEADLMLSCCHPHITDNSERLRVPYVERDDICWSDEQLEMTSTFAEHGLCYYTKESFEVVSNLGCKNKVDLVWEMLATSTNTMALGKLVTQETRITEKSFTVQIPKVEAPKFGTFLREVEPRLYNIVVSIAPARLHLALKGSAFHEYLSFLSQISKSDVSCLSKSFNRTKQQRRSRVAGHYLSSGQLALSPEHVLFLSKNGCFGHGMLSKPT